LNGADVAVIPLVDDEGWATAPTWSISATAAPAGSGLASPHHPLEDGEELDLGGLTLQVIATPGHTPEHLAYLLRDGQGPLALFSGGTLMAGGIARTDLLSPELTEPLARQAYRSIHGRLLTLPDDLPVYPTHGAGSFCSAAPGGQRTTTIGTERATNPLRADGLDGGVDAWAASGRPVATTPLAEAGEAAGRRILDVRQRPEYAAGHRLETGA
jgi:glyoxylase-like metal-dependent hydrolase (beta-lactamase superfamily II)